MRLLRRILDEVFPPDDVWEKEADRFLLAIAAVLGIFAVMLLA